MIKRGRGAKLYMERKISYQEWVDIDVQAMIMARPTVTEKDIMEALKKVELETSAKFVTAVLRKAGFKLAIVSAGIEQLAHRVARELGIDIVKANPLLFSGDGKLIGGRAVVEPLAKDKALYDLAYELKIDLSEVAYVGDSIWDLPALEVAGLPIVIGCRECAEKVKRAVLVNCLWEILPVLLRYRPRA